MEKHLTADAAANDLIIQARSKDQSGQIQQCRFIPGDANVKREFRHVIESKTSLACGGKRGYKKKGCACKQRDKKVMMVTLWGTPKSCHDKRCRRVTMITEEMSSKQLTVESLYKSSAQHTVCKSHNEQACATLAHCFNA